MIEVLFITHDCGINNTKNSRSTTMLSVSQLRQKIIRIHNHRHLLSQQGVIFVVNYFKESMKKNFANENEHLDLLQKRIEIKKKRIEIRKEKLNIGDLTERRLDVKDEQEILIAKIYELRSVLSNITVDEGRTLFGGEPFLTPIVAGDNRAIITNKLMSLIAKL